MPVVCVYASRRRPDTFVYVLRRQEEPDEATDLAPVPQALLGTLAPWRFALAFELAPDRPLAQADPERVMADIADQGFYLQLPPAELPQYSGGAS